VIGKALVALARRRDWPYLNITGGQAAATPVEACSFRWSRMAQPVFTSQEMLAAVRPARVIVVGGAGLGAAMLLGALVLWLHYGTAVFFEMIASGIAACF